MSLKVKRDGVFVPVGGAGGGGAPSGPASIVGATTAASDSDTAFTVPAPAHEPGDRLVLVLLAYAPANHPPGWALEWRYTWDGWYYCYSRIDYDGSLTGVDITHPSATTVGQNLAVMLAVRDAESVGFANGVNGAASTSANHGSNDLMLHVAHDTNFDVVTPAGVTRLAQAKSGTRNLNVYQDSLSSGTIPSRSFGNARQNAQWQVN